MLRDLAAGRADNSGVLGAAAVQVPQAYERAIDQALGAGLQNIVETNRRQSA
ncbi:MAG: hypothetical protein ACLT0Y_07440 [Christensenellales bacterium]